MERWVGRVAVVTGASSGIGAAIVQKLVKKGVLAVGLARRVQKVEKLKSSLLSERGKLYPLKCDITKDADVTETFKWVKNNLGGVDILVNNAGVCSHNTLLGGPVNNWRKIIDLNVIALSVCTKEAFQCMQERGVNDGHIVNINSICGHGTPMSLFMYSASKHAVTALTEGIRRELLKRKSSIRITSISPGRVKTELIQIIASEFNVSVDEIYNRDPHLEPKDVADAVMFALSSPPHVQIYELVIKPVGERFS